jgi:hypothetical protein
MNRVHLMVCFALVFAPLLVHAEQAVQYEIDTKFVACPSNEISTVFAAPTPLDPSALPASWTVLSAPRVTTVAGATATFAVLKNPPQYFEKQSSGSFRLRQMGHQYEIGVTLKVTTTPGSSNENVKVDYQVTFCSILRREPLPGVSLDVGLPTMDILKSHCSFEMKLDGWSFSGLDGVYPGYSNADQKMLLMLRVRRVNAKGQPTDASGRPLPE